jgi:hypothetical protein
MSFFYPSITIQDKTEPFELQVARGQVAGHKPLFKFGLNADINGSLESVWSHGSLYVYPTAATVVKVSSSSTDDSGSGTGARTVLVAGLDADYNEISETVTLNGQTAVLTTNLFLRVFRAYVVTAGSGGTAAGTIYVGDGSVTTGVPATVYAVIDVGDNQTNMAIWTVPAGYTLYIYRGTFSAASNNAAQYILGKFMVRPFGGVFRNAADITVNSSVFGYDFEIPLAVPEKSDIEARAIALAGTNFYVTASFEGVYVAGAPAAAPGTPRI